MENIMTNEIIRLGVVKKGRLLFGTATSGKGM